MAGTVKVGVDKNSLRLQFPSAVSQKIWGVRQKYKSLGLSDTPTNRLIAKRIADEVQLDIAFDRLDPSLEKYSHGILEKTLEKAKQSQIEVPTLFSLFTQYLESVKKPGIRSNTYINGYQSFLPLIKLCADADIVANSVTIVKTISQATTYARTRKALDILYSLLEWCKRQKIVNESTINPYKAYKQDIPRGQKKERPKHIIELGVELDDDFRGYSPQEAEYIIEAFSQRGNTPGLYKNLASFIFSTGCRPSEATGLRWQDISSDFSTITFRHSFSAISKELAPLKTARHGKEKRKIPCGKRLQQLLREIHERQNNPQSNSFVFCQSEGNPVYWPGFYRSWAGYKQVQTGKHINGVIEELIREGKVRTYLKPYAMRHSFITWQLAAGMTPANVAKLVGNSPEIIYKHYVSADKDPELAFEL